MVVMLVFLVFLVLVVVALQMGAKVVMAIAVGVAGVELLVGAH
jgi:hypothetical protein